MVENRIIAPQKQSGDEELYKGLRPQSLDDFVGQRTLCQNPEIDTAELIRLSLKEIGKGKIG